MPLDWRVEKMRLSKDKTQLRYNSFLTLERASPAKYSTTVSATAPPSTG